MGPSIEVGHVIRADLPPCAVGVGRDTTVEQPGRPVAEQSFALRRGQADAAPAFEEQVTQPVLECVRCGRSRSMLTWVTSTRIPQLTSLPTACGMSAPTVRSTVPVGMPAPLWKSGVHTTRSMQGSPSRPGVALANACNVPAVSSTVSSSSIAVDSSGTSGLAQISTVRSRGWAGWARSRRSGPDGGLADV